MQKEESMDPTLFGLGRACVVVATVTTPRERQQISVDQSYRVSDNIRTAMSELARGLLMAWRLARSDDTERPRKAVSNESSPRKLPRP